MTLASFLGAKGFFLPDEDDEDYWPDAHNEHRGIEYGASCPNDGALTVEILANDRWHVRVMEDNDGWDYKLASVARYAHGIIDEWLAKPFTTGQALIAGLSVGLFDRLVHRSIAEDVPRQNHVELCSILD